MCAHRVHSGLPGTHDRCHCVWDVWARGYARRNAVLKNRRRKLRPEGEDRCNRRSILFATG